MYYVAKKELFLKPWQAWFLNSLGAFPVDRDVERPHLQRLEIDRLVLIGWLEDQLDRRIAEGGAHDRQRERLIDLATTLHIVFTVG